MRVHRHQVWKNQRRSGRARLAARAAAAARCDGPRGLERAAGRARRRAEHDIALIQARPDRFSSSIPVGRRQSHRRPGDSSPLKVTAETSWWPVSGSGGAAAEMIARLWRHSVAVSIAARWLARDAGDPDPTRGGPRRDALPAGMLGGRRR